MVSGASDRVCDKWLRRVLGTQVEPMEPHGRLSRGREVRERLLGVSAAAVV